jgi:dihydropyrimidine dehydrogenase (NAD+) subunit PreA
MVPQHTGKPYMNWTQDPRNPRAEHVVAAKVVEETVAAV